MWTERYSRLHSGCCCCCCLFKEFLVRDFIVWQYIVPVAEDQEFANVVICRYVVQCRQCRLYRPADDCQCFETRYEASPESIQSFWLSREPVAWPSCNLAISQRRPYCSSVNSHSPVGLVGRQWDAVEWTCVLCDRRVHSGWASKSASSRKSAWTFYSSPAGFCGKASHRPGLSAPPLKRRFGSLRHLVFPKCKIVVESEEICECDGHTAHKFSQRRLAADWLAPRESDCTRKQSKVSSDWMPSYIKAPRPVLEIYKMARYFPDNPRTAFIRKHRQYISPKRR